MWNSPCCAGVVDTVSRRKTSVQSEPDLEPDLTHVLRSKSKRQHEGTDVFTLLFTCFHQRIFFGNGSQPASLKLTSCPIFISFFFFLGKVGKTENQMERDEKLDSFEEVWFKCGSDDSFKNPDQIKDNTAQSLVMIDWSKISNPSKTCQWWKTDMELKHLSRNFLTDARVHVSSPILSPTLVKSLYVWYEMFCHVLLHFLSFLLISL